VITIRRAIKRPLRRVRDAYRELTGPLRGLPSILIIGAQKGGTTSLFQYLVQHPDVRSPVTKEIDFFDLHHARGTRWYRGRFPYEHRLPYHAVTLDASPYYMIHPLAPQRAAELLPGARLIALLRNPIERAFSHYHHEVRGGRERLSFPDAIEREPERLAGEEERLRTDPGYRSYNFRRYSYARRGVYIEQLRRWVQHFPRSQLLVLQSEWLFRDPGAVMVAAHTFLGLRPHRLQGYTPFLQGKYEREMPPHLRRRLATYFEPYNHELFRWLGEEFDWI
jgi:hypothetical protein